MTMPISTSSVGSTKVTKRSMFVAISSSKKSATVFSISCRAPVASPTSVIFTATSGNTRVREGEALAAANARVHDVELARDVVVADGLGRDLERIDERQAA